MGPTTLFISNIITTRLSPTMSLRSKRVNEIEEDQMRQPLLHHDDSQPQLQEEEEEEEAHKQQQSSLLIYLYIGHFLARWGARMWEFTVGLYMIDIWPNSLLFTALYGVVESSSTALFGPIVGKWVDRLTYMQVLRVWLFTQNFSFVVAGGTATALLVYSSLRWTDFPIFLLLVIFTNLSGAIGVLSTLAGTILVEREWVVVISTGQSPEVLTKMNSVIRRIDLVCKLFAPVVSGFIISFVSLTASAVALTLWNIVSVSLQYWLLKSVYKGIPALSENCDRRSARLSQSSEVENSSILPDTEILVSQKGTDTDSGESNWKRKFMERISKFSFIDAWIVYFQQDVVLPGIAIALLYFSVLSFGSLMTATLEWEGIPVYVIGIMRGISATIGIAATVLYPVLQSRIWTLRTGLWSIWMQWTFLLVCVVSVWISNRYTSAWMLMSGVAASRLGLWMFDLSVIQQMQDQVPDSDRCVVGGVQNSLQSMLDLLTYVMGIVVSNPQDFGILIMMSFLLTTLAATLYSIHIYRVRKHLFHFDKLLVMVHWVIRRS